MRDEPYNSLDDLTLIMSGKFGFSLIFLYLCAIALTKIVQRLTKMLH